ncbi:MAG TPA: hypothetical protein VFO54_10395, partial [Chryseosolibacter sp.]|nr:hypothetical protein [Chryseosolibacter sp.]
ILRVVGTLLLGPVTNDHYLKLTDALWFEKLGGITLVLSIAAIGMAPLWLSNLLHETLATLLQPFIN